MTLTLSPYDSQNQFILASNAQPPPARKVTGFYAHQLAGDSGGWVIKHGHPRDGEHGLTIFPSRGSTPPSFATAQAAAGFLEGKGL